MKLIFSLRNPIERAFSHYLHHKTKEKVAVGTFREAIKKRPGFYIKPGFYYKHLSRYLRYFKRENILVLLFDDLKNNPQTFMKTIYNFLKVNDKFIPRSLHTRINYRGIHKARIPHLNRLLRKARNVIHANPHLRPLSEFSKKLRLRKLTEWIRLTNTDLNRPPSERVESQMSPKTREHLKELYRPDIQQLAQLLQKDLGSWLS